VNGDETTHLSRCSFSAFSTSVYSKDDALFYCNSHIDKVTEEISFFFHNKKMTSTAKKKEEEEEEKDKITIYHSYNLNSLHFAFIFSSFFFHSMFVSLIFADALTHFFFLSVFLSSSHQSEEESGERV
jgi:hypothetical protein